MLNNYDIHIQMDEVKSSSTNGTKLQRIEKAVDSEGKSIEAYYVVSDYVYNIFIIYNNVAHEIRILQAKWAEKYGRNFTSIIITANSNDNSLGFSGTTYSVEQHERLIEAIREFLHEMFDAYFDL